MEKYAERLTKVILIAGPTSSGKTSLAIKLCRRYNGEVISADSRQVVKKMDLGTGKVPLSEAVSVKKQEDVWNIGGINIWGYDLVDPDEYFSGYDYTVFAQEKIKTLTTGGKNIFISGGTGFYLDLLAGRITPNYSAPIPALREELEMLEITELREMLRKLNIRVYEKTDINNKVRIIRAIEREKAFQTGETAPVPGTGVKNLKFYYLGLKSENQVLFKNADTWVEKVWEAGLVKETSELINLGYENSHRLKGLVYKTCVSYIRGEIKEDQALERIKYDLHAYIRRQLTWFRKNPEIIWFDISDNHHQKKVEEFVDYIYNKDNG